MIPKTIKQFKKVKTINKPVAEAGKKVIQNRIRHIETTAKLPKYGDQRLPAPRRKAVSKYKDVIRKIDKIPLRKDKPGLTARRSRLETSVLYNKNQPKGVAQGYRPPIVSKPRAKALKKLGSKIKTDNNYKKPTDRKEKLPGRGTPERTALAQRKKAELQKKHTRRFNNKMNVHMTRNRKGTNTGRPEKLQKLLTRRKANKNLYQGLEGL